LNNAQAKAADAVPREAAREEGEAANDRSWEDDFAKVDRGEGWDWEEEKPLEADEEMHPGDEGWRANFNLYRCDEYKCERTHVFDHSIRYQGAATSQVVLTWAEDPASVLILTKSNDPEIRKIALEAVRFVTEERGLVVYLEDVGLAIEALERGMQHVRPFRTELRPNLAWDRSGRRTHPEKDLLGDSIDHEILTIGAEIGAEVLPPLATTPSDNDALNWPLPPDAGTLTTDWSGPTEAIVVEEYKPSEPDLDDHQEEEDQVGEQVPVDFVMTFGGDGLLMHANTIFKEAVPPLLCFNLGSLGFLTPFPHEHFRDEIDRLLNGNLMLSLRMRLTCTILREGKPHQEFNVLNEVVIDRGSSPYLSNLECYCDGQHLTTVQADGIIIATPTGSTAYSMSAGGSIMHPSVPAILFTPICPHSLSFRPVIFPDSAVLRCDVPTDARNEAAVSFDGKHQRPLRRGDSIEIKMSYFPVPTVCRRDHTRDWFSSLDNALNFNLRSRQKPLNDRADDD